LAIVVILRGKSAGRRVPISTWPATIGRDNGCSVIVDGERVSRMHARIKKRDRTFILEDLDSRNGTYLNGDKAMNAIIQSGDKIIIGDCELMFLTPEAQIDIVTEMLDFEHVLSQDLGIDQPIELGDDITSKAGPIRRLTPIKDQAIASQSGRAARLVLENHANLLEATNFEDACDMTLKALHTLMKQTSRSAIFLWSPTTRRLLPVATRFAGKRRPFALSKRAFEDVVARKQGVLISPNTAGVTQSFRHRLILPILAHQDVICLVHAEGDSIHLPFEAEDIDTFRLFLLKASANLENFVLRRDLDSYMVGIIESMIATLEAKDTYTHGHSERVSRYCMAIADEMQLSTDVKKSLLMSSLCHDIGKIGIPDAILRKASLLNPDEYEEMKQHPTIGANIVGHLPNARKILSGVKYHHEKWDGSGYPDGLVGEDIPFFGRIVAVADVFDAMISGRTYSGFMDSSDAVEKLTSESDLFDPDILQAVENAYNKGILTQRTSTKQNMVKEDTGQKKQADLKQAIPLKKSK
jgi:HD-GYP domain-containing protein (c-di-GMP phosphodiesterase class II)/pSer/pThr/pTyr-binding forkhead associated (FHA) protein